MQLQYLIGPVLMLAACSGSSTPAPPADPAPEFLLMDVNATSPTYDQGVSPRDHLGGTSAWYFGSAT
ncbi:MAG: hypothetical protein ACYTEZ_03100 [Planctomycetota bacterium]|jgi:hypothetical protein